MWESKIKIILFDVFDMLAFLVFVLWIIFVIRIFIINPFNIVWTSMLPTFDDWDFVLINKISTKFGTINRWDVVVFVPPWETIPYIKRIIWLPWETVKIIENNIYICSSETEPKENCNKLKEDYLSIWTVTETKNKDVFVVEDGYFVMWDNRTDSTDSRFCFGSNCLKNSNFVVPKKDILWKVVIRLIPNIETNF